MRRSFAVLIHLASLAVFATAQAPEEPVPYSRSEVIYGRKFGTALTFDVIQPAKTNGYGLIFMVSGGFYSSHEAINPTFMKPLLDRGYTVFAVVHGSQPRFVIPEIAQDIHRSVRFIRKNSDKYGVRPDKLGIFGASAGGHLSLTMGTQGGPGDPNAKDPIDRESSEIQAVACFFPPTDFLNWNGVDAVGVGPLAGFKGAFGSRSDTEEERKKYGREISPLNFVSAKMAPSLIIHGDADKLVPIQQAEIFEAKAKEVGAVCRVIRREGKDHGWGEMGKDLELFADWFDEHLRGVKPSARAR